MATSIEEIKKLIHDTIQISIGGRPKQDEPALELILDELRIIYNRLDESMATVRLRTLTFLGAGLALLGYLYSGNDLFIPPEVYGKVFYFMGLGLFVAGLSFLLYALRPSQWAVPLETKLTRLSRYSTKLDLLELTIEEYVESMMANISRYEKKCLAYTTGFSLLLPAAIILLVLKSIGGL